ncbi:uncharacterized protein [Musca autumnalis]|uniref:uncharacterized protein n=1 Tax=Musca autumnalis TaxID=221902 RepID=UPI003CF23D74
MPSIWLLLTFYTHKKKYWIQTVKLNKVNNYEINDIFRDAVDRARKIVKVFKRSPLKNARLQKYAKEELNKEVHPVIDVKTRWNSMVAMLQNFLKAKTAIMKTLIDFDSANLWNEDDVPVIEILVNVLYPIKEAVEALSRRDTNLIIADAVLKKLYDQLNSIDHTISRKLLETIKARITDRRDSKMMSLLKFLRDPDSLGNTDVPKKVVKLYAEEIYGRLFSDVESDVLSGSDDDIPNVENVESFESKLKEAIAAAKSTPRKSKPCHKSFFRKELALYEVSKSRTKRLDYLYDALLSIKPTSVECERTFSIAGNFCTKKRNRMSSDLLNALVVLKSYFLKSN